MRSMLLSTTTRTTTRTTTTTATTTTKPPIVIMRIINKSTNNFIPRTISTIVSSNNNTIGKEMMTSTVITTTTTTTTARRTTSNNNISRMYTKRTTNIIDCFGCNNNNNNNNNNNRFNSTKTNTNTNTNTNNNTNTNTNTNTNITSKIGTLRIVGPDSNGIVAACTEILNRYGCNIMKSEQWTDRQNNYFFQRLAFTYNTTTTTTDTTTTDTTTATDTTTTDIVVNKEKCENEIIKYCNDMNLISYINWRDKPIRIGIMVSKYDHCLWEILLRYKAHELGSVDNINNITIDLVISNHNKLKDVATTFNIPYYVIPITSTNKKEQETKQLQLLKETYNIDILILARYMQILSNDFLNEFSFNNNNNNITNTSNNHNNNHNHSHKIINIHHSFLPAFIGSKPYHGAYERGVKLIGATAHYTTNDLDDGPIIDQDVIHVTHRDNIQTLIRKGQILERNVLLRALEAHLDDRIIVYNNKCIIFSD